MNRTTDKIRKFVTRHGLINKEEKILIALSGGADSVFLFRTLLNMKVSCEAVHCNFHLRGEESNRDENFVRNLCKDFGVVLHVKDFDTLTYAKTSKQSIELAARELRYTYFEQLRQEIGASVIAVAHHQDDNVETLIWNMVRGTGLRGLRGILPRNGFIIRPLLCVSRQEILAELEDMKQDFVTDSTNLEDDVTRNKIRLNIIPLLQGLNPSAKNNIATMMENMEDVWNIYNHYINQMQAKAIVKKTKEEGFVIDLSKLEDCVSITSILHETLFPLGFNRKQIEDMMSAVSGSEFLSSKNKDSQTFTAHIVVNKHGRKISVEKTQNELKKN